LKLYYHMSFSKQRITALHEAMLAANLESPYAEWLEKWDDAAERRDRGPRITTRVPCGEYFHQRDDALRAHATQVDPDGFWFRVPLDDPAAAWPTEDYELARSLVDTRARGRPVRRGTGDAELRRPGPSVTWRSVGTGRDRP
jgi:mycothiol S-conjugate amidase